MSKKRRGPTKSRKQITKVVTVTPWYRKTKVVASIVVLVVVACVVAVVASQSRAVKFADYLDQWSRHVEAINKDINQWNAQMLKPAQVLNGLSKKTMPMVDGKRQWNASFPLVAPILKSLATDCALLPPALQSTSADAKAVNRIYNILRNSCDIFPEQTTTAENWYKTLIGPMVTKAESDSFKQKIVALNDQRKKALTDGLAALKPYVTAAQLTQIEKDQNLAVG